MEIEKNAGTLLAWGIIAYLIGGVIFLNGWINNLSANLPSQESQAPVIIGAILVLAGTGLVISGIYKIARNLEINTEANDSAERHLRWIRNSMAAQQTRDEQQTQNDPRWQGKV